MSSNQQLPRQTSTSKLSQDVTRRCRSTPNMHNKWWPRSKVNLQAPRWMASLQSCPKKKLLSTWKQRLRSRSKLWRKLKPPCPPNSQQLKKLKWRWSLKWWFNRQNLWTRSSLQLESNTRTKILRLHSLCTARKTPRLVKHLTITWWKCKEAWVAWACEDTSELKLIQNEDERLII